MSEQEVSTSQALVAKGLPLSGIINRQQATAILNTIWKGAPELEVYKAAMLCQDYGLHPLMKHVYLIKYDRYKKQKDGSKLKVGEDWATVLGIGATRLITARQGTFSYVDDTPRIMSEAEQIKIFGKVDTANIVAITKLRTKDGLEASGYGKYPKAGGYLIGEDKGNSRENLAFIRSERNAFGRLFPDAALPKDVDVVDEQYMETPSGKVAVATGEIVEGEIVEEEQPEPPSEPPEQVLHPEEVVTKVDVLNDTVTQLKADLKTLAGKELTAWASTNVLSYLNTCSGKEHKKISEAFNDLSDNQKQEFLTKVKETLAMA